MLIRIAIYLLGLTLTHYMVNYVFHRNFSQGIYPPEADSISIAIFTNQIVLYGIAMFMLPTAILGNRWFVGKVAITHLLARCVVAVLLAGLYAVSIIVCLIFALSSLDSAHFELSLSYLLMLLVLLGFLASDVIRIYREFFKNPSANPLRLSGES